MANQILALGTTADDGTGDNLRVGGDKINDNFLELYTALGDGDAIASGISASATVISLVAPNISGTVAGTQTAATITTLATTTVNGTTLNGGTLALAAGSITDSSGAISFGNENLTTTGTLGVGAITTTGAFKGADGYTIGNASVAAVMTLASSGIVTFADDILIKDGGTIGNATTAAAIQIEADGDIVLSDDLYISGGLLDLKNEGSVSQIKLYCESSNAHAQTLQSAPHSLASSAVCVLPTASGTLIGTGDTGTLPLVAIDIDGGTDIGADLATTDLIIVDDGAGGTNRKAALSRVITLAQANLDDPVALALALG
tara:strand:+ start:137 stop:1087 length:951 start_codon:yes stop_codon:yes gene_type:complete